MKKKVMFILAVVILLALTACGVSKEKMVEMNQETLEMLSTCKTGDEVVFGSFQKKPIVWNVIDIKDGLYLLLAIGSKTKQASCAIQTAGRARERVST